MVKKEVKRGLGRGLNALFGDEEDDVTLSQAGDQPVQQRVEMPVAAASEAAPQNGNARTSKFELDVDQMQPGEFQPRTEFADEPLNALAESIKKHGLIQPILVRALAGQPGKYEIIAGERRWRASQLANLHRVPVIVSTFDDQQALEVALVENLQREDLNPVDEAMGYIRLMQQFGHTQEKTAEMTGKSRSHIANMTRLLTLPPQVQNYLREGKITAGHARALVPASDAERLVEEIVRKNLNVRQTEALVGTKGKPLNKKLTNTQKDADVYALQNDLSNMLGMRVTIETNADGRSGALKVQFKTLDQLDEVIRRLSKIPAMSFEN